MARAVEKKSSHRWYRRIALFALVVVVATGVTAFRQRRAAHELIVTVFDVGQGDAVLVELPEGGRWLIDGGPDERVVASLDQRLPWWDRTLTGIILTHPHADHVAGLVAVLRRYRVRHVVVPAVSHTTPEYLTFLEEVRSRNLPTTFVSRPFVWTGGSAASSWRWEFLHPERAYDEAVSDLNAASVVSRLVYGEHKFLFMGDATVEVESLLLKQGRDLRATVLKVGHHGGDTATSESFLKAVQPTYAAISVGASNRFGHPAEVILRRLRKNGVMIYRTDEHGDITFRTDGHAIKSSIGR